MNPYEEAANVKIVSSRSLGPSLAEQRRLFELQIAADLAALGWRPPYQGQQPRRRNREEQ